MTGQPTPDTPPREPHTAVMLVDAANVNTDLWCGVCKALTGFTADLVTVTSQGVSTLGTITGCVICDDPDDPRPKEA